MDYSFDLNRPFSSVNGDAYGEAFDGLTTGFVTLLLGVYWPCFSLPNRPFQTANSLAATRESIPESFLWSFW